MTNLLPSLTSYITTQFTNLQEGMTLSSRVLASL